MQHEYVIKNRLGLHARPARKLVEVCKKFKCDVFLEKEGKQYNAKSLISVLLAGASCGEKIMLITEGEQEEEALRIIGDLLASKID
jgi:phosphocarrier protein HPr